MKVLIVDDHPIVRSSLRRLLLPQAELDVSETADGREVVGLFRHLRPDLVILDLSLPGLSGLEVLRRLKIENLKARILIVSMYANPVYVARALEAGARGYISKSAPPEHILDAITAVAAGHEYIEHELAQELALWNLREPAHPLRQLSSRDVEILRLLAEGHSLAEIAGAIGITYKTVANHCSQLKARLAAPRMADLIRIAISSGLRGEDDLLGGLLPGGGDPDRRI